MRCSSAAWRRAVDENCQNRANAHRERLDEKSISLNRPNSGLFLVQWDGRRTGNITSWHMVTSSAEGSLQFLALGATSTSTHGNTTPLFSRFPRAGNAPLSWKRRASGARGCHHTQRQGQRTLCGRWNLKPELTCLCGYQMRVIVTGKADDIRKMVMWRRNHFGRRCCGSRNSRNPMNPTPNTVPDSCDLRGDTPMACLL